MEDGTLSTFDRLELDRAITFQAAGFRLLQWVRSQLQRGNLKFDVTHEAMTDQEIARDWLRTLRGMLPEDCRPDEGETQEFANMFASFLKASYVLDPSPESRQVSHCGCWCCAALSQAEHLRPRRLTKRHRHYADQLKWLRLGELAGAADSKLSADDVESLSREPSLQQDLALFAYGHELLRRLRGYAVDESSYALWREFAWTKAGALDRSFRLSSDVILTAERRLLHVCV
ncbi:hypothetical protein [Stratiformator vulcanicus]|uniref:Uncharacterized protein n=1 Tax=Stratiformator vulcanicus TaxID=2527980 RepID=A0A517QXZ4_9PLAN|nr:hypothetical protein [Stratiformator vulcanicus]QDT36526.1 hypothetical protein Pan189_08850 [Stratiformator vulcanicus]